MAQREKRLLVVVELLLVAGQSSHFGGLERKEVETDQRGEGGGIRLLTPESSHLSCLPGVCCGCRWLCCCCNACSLLSAAISSVVCCLHSFSCCWTISGTVSRAVAAAPTPKGVRILPLLSKLCVCFGSVPPQVALLAAPFSLPLNLSPFPPPPSAAAPPTAPFLGGALFLGVPAQVSSREGAPEEGNSAIAGEGSAAEVPSSS